MRDIFEVRGVLGAALKRPYPGGHAPDMKAARRRGAHLEQPPKLAPHQVAHACELVAGGKTWGEIAAPLGVSPNTLWRALRGCDGIAT